MGYWDATHQIMKRGGAPKCSKCGKVMTPADDHGRFICGCQGLRIFDAVAGVPVRTSKISQVDTSVMSNEEKAKVPPVNRLHSQPTSAEARYLALLAEGPEVMDSPEYLEACKELEEERRKAQGNGKSP